MSNENQELKPRLLAETKRTAGVMLQTGFYTLDELKDIITLMEQQNAQAAALAQERLQ